jgi:hypothetical protein
MRITSVVSENGYHRFRISPNFRKDIAAAVQCEHPCDDSNCDIFAALKGGFPFVAAYLLASATETPIIASVFKAHEFNGTADEVMEGRMPEGWKEWCGYFVEISWKCEKCGTHNCDPESDKCGNCLAQRETQEVDEED